MGVYNRLTSKGKPWRDGKNSQFKRTMKERRQFDTKKSEVLESEVDNFDVDNLHPTSPFKGRNIYISICIVDLDFVYKQLLDWCKANCST